MKRNGFLTIAVLIGILFLAYGHLSADKADKCGCVHWPGGKNRECTLRDSEGNVIGKKTFRENGSLYQVEEFDDLGNKLEESYYNEEGSLMQNPVDNWAAKRWKYQNNRLAEEEFFGQDGRLTERNIYNEEGDLINRQFFGSDRATPQESVFNQSTLVDQEEDFYHKDGKPGVSIDAVSDDFPF